LNNEFSARTLTVSDQSDMTLAKHYSSIAAV